MGKKKNNKNFKTVNRKEEEREDIASSPFASITLREKKEEKPKAVKTQQKPKKPSEIVHGYDPGASFADILYNYEHTGNPYAMPRKSRSEEIKNSKTSFADIFSKWEKKTSAPEKKGEYRRASEVYKPKRSFADILSSYEGGNSGSKVKARVDIKNPALYEDEDEGIASEKNALKAEGASEYKRASKAYKPTRSFADILDEAEERGRKRDVPDVSSRTDDVQPADAGHANADSPTVNLFKEMEEDDEIPSNVSWSVFSGAQEIVREKEDDSIKVEKVTEEEPVSPHQKPVYEPSRSFASILSEYESTAADKTAEVSPAPSLKKEEPEIASSNLFRQMDEDDEIPSDVSWSVFSGAREIERKSESSPEQAFVPEKENRSVPVRKHVKAKPSQAFIRHFDDDVKSFEDILKEKGDLNSVKRQKTINELRLMMPESTLDLHGMTSAEAESAIRSFISDALDAGIEKVAIIHGKGLHSADGVGILRDVSINVLKELSCCREMCAAKPAYGGQGVLWVILRKKESPASDDNPLSE